MSVVSIEVPADTLDAVILQTLKGQVKWQLEHLIELENNTNRNEFDEKEMKDIRKNLKSFRRTIKYFSVHEDYQAYKKDLSKLEKKLRKRSK